MWWEKWAAKPQDPIFFVGALSLRFFVFFLWLVALLLCSLANMTRVSAVFLRGLIGVLSRYEEPREAAVEPGAAEAGDKKVLTAYYFTRSRHHEHPHFIEVSVSSS
ncbi:hypothetical protein GUJ93_ZPchr0001g31750 [Zizania palustris]|uniref:Uncharacterized protein n=1 Tax=Zizania palustris TaxID=103762 RepID=A0A8J5VAD5_ZIZPA|nr:hypothetical protein GUJ93_ZPchr0001g31750 [Zizania palustris]